MSKAASLTGLVAKKGDGAPPADAVGRVKPAEAPKEAPQTAPEPAQAPATAPEPRQPAQKAKKVPAKKAKAKPAKEAPAEPPAEPAPRKRPWDGQDDIIKVNYEVPRRVQTKLHMLKVVGGTRNMKSFVAEALEAALDRALEDYEKSGGA